MARLTSESSPLDSEHLNGTELELFLTKMAAGKKGHRRDYRDTRGGGG